jgi:CheY-like chemotaxis protein
MTSKNIFLVEDNKDDQFFFEEAIDKIENAVLLGMAVDGEKALLALRNSPVLPDIIFMDINMPRMNGIECLMHLANDRQLRHLPVVMLTSSTGELELARSLGAKAFIKKIANQNLMCTRLAEMINLDFTVNADAAARTFQTAMVSF